MKVLVIYSHSYHDTSHAGRVILDVFKAQSDFEVRNLEEIYPNCAPINIALEQQRLVEADVIIFHHPIFWFNMPAGLKHYMDEVFQYGFAYGSTGDKLRGKKFIHSYTTGSGAATFAGELGEILPAALKALLLSPGGNPPRRSTTDEARQWGSGALCKVTCGESKVWVLCEEYTLPS